MFFLSFFPSFVTTVISVKTAFFTGNNHPISYRFLCSNAAEAVRVCFTTRIILVKEEMPLPLPPHRNCCVWVLGSSSDVPGKHWMYWERPDPLHCLTVGVSYQEWMWSVLFGAMACWFRSTVPLVGNRSEFWLVGFGPCQH